MEYRDERRILAYLPDERPVYESRWTLRELAKNLAGWAIALGVIAAICVAASVGLG